MKYIKLFEKFNNKVTVYHGGENELTNSNIRPFIFTTSNVDGAMWYVDRIGEDGYLTKLELNYTNPLTCESLEEFKNKWIPILKDTNINYTFKEYKNNSWSFESYDIIKHGGHIENNVFDLIYIDEFKKSVIKHGYDCIIGWDALSNGEIPIYIPIKSEVINVISSEEINFEMFENHSIYKEIEFVCVNSDSESATTIENQLNLYNDLKRIDGLLPYIQDWSEGDNIQKSLAVIIIKEDDTLKDIIKQLANKHNVEIDLTNDVNHRKVDEIIRGDLENLV